MIIPCSKLELYQKKWAKPLTRCFAPCAFQLYHKRICELSYRNHYAVTWKRPKTISCVFRECSPLSPRALLSKEAGTGDVTSVGRITGVAVGEVSGDGMGGRLTGVIFWVPLGLCPACPVVAPSTWLN